MENGSTIEVVNAHLVSVEYIRIVELAAWICPWTQIRRFVYDDGTSYASAWQVDADGNEMTVCLYALFDRALTAVLNPDHWFSLRGDFWMNYLVTVLGGFLAASEDRGYPPRVDTTRSASVVKANHQLGMLLGYVGEHYDVEPPSLNRDSFLGPLVEGSVAAGEKLGQAWAAQQRAIINDIWRPPCDWDLLPMLVRDFFKWATGNMDNREWPQFVPVFGADEAEVEKVRQRNVDWRRHQEKMEREHQSFLREMAFMEKIDREMDEMMRGEGEYPADDDSEL